MTKNEVLIHENKQQRENRSAYFDHTRLSIFTTCCYLRDAKNKMICESVTISSELSDHSRAAAITSVLIVIDHLREKQHVPLKNNFIVWSDGFSAQFQSQFVFKLLSRIDSCLNITWCYNERHHGKGHINGTGGTLKDCVYHDVMSGKCVIDIPKPFAEHVDKTVKRITYLYLPAKDVLIEPDDIEASPKIKDNLEIHMIKRFFDEQSVPYLQFFKMTKNGKPLGGKFFFTQFYGEVGHQQIAVDDNHCGSSLGVYEPTKEWLQCPRCKVWFYSNCFFD